MILAHVIVAHATAIYVTCTAEDTDYIRMLTLLYQPERSCMGSSHTMVRMSMITVIDAKSVDG